MTEYRTNFDWLRAHIDHDGDDCLTWPYGLDDKGYAQVVCFDRIRKAHRVMCELVNGIPPTPKHQASHTCGNGSRGCVNPKHLEWKTNSENQRDRRKHGTHLGGIGTRTRLTPAQIAEIRSLNGVLSKVKIAEKFGVKRGCVEYWHRHDRDPLPPGQSKSAVQKRRVRSAEPLTAV